MARPVKISKTNFFIILMGTTLFDESIKNELLNQYSQTVLNELEEYACNSHIDYTKHRILSDFSKIGILIKDGNYKGLTNFLNQDKNRRFPISKLGILEVFVHMIHWSKIDRDTLAKNHIYPSSYTKPFYNFVFKNIETVRSPNIVFEKISVDLEKEISTLILGYEIYLKEIRKKKKSKLAICNEIEQNINVVNVRQEFDRYDKYYLGFKHYSKNRIELPDNIKIFILNGCLKHAKAPPPF